MIDHLGHMSARLPHRGEPYKPLPAPAGTVEAHHCSEDGCPRCTAREALSTGRDVFGELESGLLNVRELLEVAALIGPAQQDVLVPYLDSPMLHQPKPSGALVDAAYRAVEAAQLLLWAARGQDFRYLVRASSCLTASAYGAARVIDRQVVMAGIDESGS
ncbi:hypothetical protein [Streptomyces nojiriensis]|uniref:hypothetical protein n=1 Tax=Streptomyces nojiriensis TaxID=66374 RepID=UPI0036545113